MRVGHILYVGYGWRFWREAICSCGSPTCMEHDVAIYRWLEKDEERGGELVSIRKEVSPHVRLDKNVWEMFFDDARREWAALAPADRNTA